MIDPANRREFEDVGVDDVRKRVQHHTWAIEKERQAREWLDEKNPAWASALAAQASARAAGGANTRATIALVISGFAALIALGALYLQITKP
jgi:hypothetical protein